MATPAIRSIRNSMSEIDELCVIGRYAPVAVLEGTPWIDSTITFKPRSKDSKTFSRRGLVSNLKSRGFDMIILLPNSLSAGLIGYLSGAKRRVGFAKDGRTWLLTDPLSRRNANFDFDRVSAIESYLHIAQHLGCGVSDKSMQLFVDDSDRELARSVYSKFLFSWDSPTVVFNTSSATATSRLWPVGHASRAARMLADQHGVQILVHCGPADRDRAHAIAFGASHPLVRSLGEIDDIPIGLSKALLERASVVVSTDSGPRHMAVALNKRVVSLFGPTSPKETQTYNHPERILSLSMDCQPCGKTKCPLIHNNCMHGLSYVEVVRAILEQLESSKDEDMVGSSGISALPGSAA